MPIKIKKIIAIVSYLIYEHYEASPDNKNFNISTMKLFFLLVIELIGP